MKYILGGIARFSLGLFVLFIIFQLAKLMVYVQEQYPGTRTALTVPEWAQQGLVILSLLGAAFLIGTVIFESVADHMRKRHGQKVMARWERELRADHHQPS